MPGVLILESMAQATGILAFHTRQDKPDARQLYLLVSVDKARFKRPVVPGDQVILTVSFVRRIKNMMKFNTTASVDDKVVASAQIMCASKEYES